MLTRTLFLCTLAILPVLPGPCVLNATDVVMTASPGLWSDNACYLVAGTEVNITCTVALPDRTSSDLLISPDNYEITILNSTSIVCVIPHINETMNIACCVDRCLDSTEPSFQGSTQVSINMEVGDLPTYENLSCQVFVDEHLVCTWYAYGPGSWTFQYGIIDNTPKKNASWCLNVMCLGSCENNTDGQYRCNDTGIFLSHPYSIVLTGQNDYGVSQYNMSSSMFGVTYRRMTNVSVQSVGPTWIELVWQQPRGQEFVDEVWKPLYNVTVTAGGNVSMIKTTNETHIRLSVLQPYTNYTIRLEAKPIGVHQGLGHAVWSRGVALQQRTMEAKPSHSPLVTPGGYSWSSDLQKLTVYWKAIPRENRNGDIVRYRVRIDTKTTNLTGNVSSKTWDNIDVDVGHVVTVAGGTKANLSVPAQMVIHQANKDLPRVDYVVAEKISSVSYNVTWMTSQKYVDHVTVTRCRGTNTLSVNNFGWTTLSNTSTQVTVDAQGHGGGDLWFGVSLTFRNLTYGITWNKCIFDIDEENHAPTPDVTATARAVHVHWGPIFCDKAVMKSRPLFYVVIYTSKSPNKPCVCDHGVVYRLWQHIHMKYRTYRNGDSDCCTHTKGPNITIPALFNTSGIVIDNLKTSENYCICVRIRTKQGLGPPSSPITTRLENIFSTKAKVLVGLFSSLILVFIILVVRFLCRRYKQASYPIDLSLWKDLGQNTDGKIREDADGEMENNTGAEVGQNCRDLHLQPLGSVQHSRSSPLCHGAPPPPTAGVGGTHQPPKHEEELGPKCVSIPVSINRSSTERKRRKSLTSHGGEEVLSDRDKICESSLRLTNAGNILSFNHYVGRPGSGLKPPSSSVTDLEQNQPSGPNPGQTFLPSTRDDGCCTRGVVKYSSETDYVLLSRGLNNKILLKKKEC